jgi:predicted nucleic acid-binding protein
MKDRFFIDTNIIIYVFDKKNKDKKVKAQNILKQALSNTNGILSFQVIQEFCNVALKKFEIPLSASDCKTFINNFLFPICDIFPGLELYNKAIEIKESTNYGFYDSLIIASAIEGKCNILYSEDLNNNEKVMGLQIVNPFLS